MKTVVNNLIWFSLFALMASVKFYPSISPVAQSVIWVLNPLILIIGILGITAATFDKDKDRLNTLASTRKGIIRRTFGWIKFAMTFSAIAYAGFSVAAAFYAIGAFLIAGSVLIARDRLKEMQ